MHHAEFDHAPEWLRTGTVVGIGRIAAGSNATFAVSLQCDGAEQFAIYKPRAGERPLWDFPDGTLYQREAATYLTAQALGWDMVPPTVVREGPYGVGSFQLYCEPDAKRDFWRVRRKRRDDLRRIAIFDIITNNADRKGEHCHLGADGTIYAIDNGLTFNVEFKNRTVLADFAGEPVPDGLKADMRALLEPGTKRNALQQALSGLLAPDEVAEFFARLETMCRMRRIPRVIPHWELYYDMVE